MARASVAVFLLRSATKAPTQQAATCWRIPLFTLFTHLPLAFLLHLRKLPLQNALGWTGLVSLLLLLLFPLLLKLLLILLPLKQALLLLLLFLLLLLAQPLVAALLPIPLAGLLAFALLARVFLALLQVLALLPLAALVLGTLAFAPFLAFALVLGAAPAVVRARVGRIGGIHGHHGLVRRVSGVGRRVHRTGRIHTATAAVDAAAVINSGWLVGRVGVIGKGGTAAQQRAEGGHGAQGKQAAEAWGKLMNVEITWFDGELSATKQRAAIDNIPYEERSQESIDSLLDDYCAGAAQPIAIH